MASDGSANPRPEPTARSLDLERLLEERERLELLIKQKFTRTVTIMFTDLKGSTSLAETAGDVNTRYLIKKHNDIVFPSIRENGGVLVKTMGDGTLSYFERAQLAVRAAVRIQREIRGFNLVRQGATPLQVRIGLNTGIGIIEKNDIYGDAVNVASRYESLARPGEIYVSESTDGALEDRAEFHCRYLQTSRIEGKKELHKVFKVFWDEEEIARDRAAGGGASGGAGAAPPESDETITLGALQAFGAREDTPEAREVLERAKRLEHANELVELYLLCQEHRYPTLQATGSRLAAELESARQRETSLGGHPAVWFFRKAITIGRVADADFPLTNKALSRVPVHVGIRGASAYLTVESRGLRDLKAIELERDGGREPVKPDVEQPLGAAGSIVFSVCFPLEYRLHKQRFLVLRLLDPRECLRRHFTFTLQEIWRDFDQESSRLIVVGT